VATANQKTQTNLLFLWFLKIAYWLAHFFLIFFGVPHLDTCIFLFFYNEPELGKGIDPGMALTPLPSSNGQGSNPRPSDLEPSALPLELDHSFRFWSAHLKS